MIKTKTIATIGPATQSHAALEQLIDAGVNVLRLNFSHGTLAEHSQVLKTARALAQERDTALAILGDLSGPKIRIGQMDPQQSSLRTGEKLIIQRQTIVGNNRRLSTNYPAIVDEADVGQKVLIDDGQIQLRIDQKSSDELVCHCIHGGTLSNHKGVNLPETSLNISALTTKDCEDLNWAMENKLDYLALSFVRSAADIQELRRQLDPASHIDIIAKIEKPQAIQQIDEIINAADGILVARGDLGVEMELSQVPLLQKEITRKCRWAGKPVIIATQMLQSMVNSPTPTRAEVSDVANAILDTTDAVMLSAETAVGKFPVEALHTMQDICQKTETYQQQNAKPEKSIIEDRDFLVTSSIAQSAKSLADRLNPPLVAVWTQSGQSAKLLSKHRFHQPIVALTENIKTLNKLALYYGVISIKSPCPTDAGEMLNLLDRILLERDWVMPGQSIIVIAGTKFAHTGGNNALLIHQIGRS